MVIDFVVDPELEDKPFARILPSSRERGFT